VPKTPILNLRFRREILRRVLEEPEWVPMLRWACAQDPLFYLNTFVWTYNPKRTGRKKVPFITYPYEDEAVADLLDSIDNQNDVLIEKSRQMGASWTMMATIEWLWHFRHMQNILVGSRTDEYVDKSDEPKSLFFKLDFIWNNLPVWLMPVGWDRGTHRKVKRVVNPENHSVIVGEATTPNFGRGGSFTLIGLDEFAACEVGMSILKATRDATPTRWFNSTPAGTGNAYYRMRQQATQAPEQIKLLRFHWSQNPLYGAGQYTSDKAGKLEKLDPEYEYPDDYPFLTDGKLRSPWYDRQCKRAATQAEIAQELDIDYLGSGYQFFDQNDIETLIASYCCPSRCRGDVILDLETVQVTQFAESDRGRLALWCHLDHGSPPIDRSYVLGVDAAAGTGASNSVISIWDAKTKEKVAEYVDPHVKPEGLARVAVALCRWFGGAMLIWETNGSGRAFGDAVLEIGYGLYYARAKDTETGETGGKAGWAPTRDNKYQLLAKYRGMLHDRTVVNRCEQAMRETLEYVFLGNNWVEHASLNDNEDPSGARDQHGDRVIADALAVKILDDQPKTPSVAIIKPSTSSLAGRRELWKRQAQERSSVYVF
jgi:hypothetical protein